ncbi:LOW QUALITY PROTEIN: ADP/ATP translocase 4 [Rhynochetos jubatus]
MKSDVGEDSSSFRKVLAGGVVAAISKMVVGLIEWVELLLQVRASSKQIQADGQPKGMVDCSVCISREKIFLCQHRIYTCLGKCQNKSRIFSFCRGNLANVMWCFPTQAPSFAFKDKYKRVFMSKGDKEKTFWKRFLANLASGGTAGATSMCMEDGLPGLHQGSGVSVQGITVYRASCFGCDTMKGLLPNPKRAPFILSFFIAQVVTTCSGMLSYPSDAVRRRMMMQSGETEHQWKGTADCFMKIHKREGQNAFFRGMFSNTPGGAGGASVLVLYDRIKVNFNLESFRVQDLIRTSFGPSRFKRHPKQRGNCRGDTRVHRAVGLRGRPKPPSASRRSAGPSSLCPAP